MDAAEAIRRTRAALETLRYQRIALLALKWGAPNPMERTGKEKRA